MPLPRNEPLVKRLLDLLASFLGLLLLAPFFGFIAWRSSAIPPARSSIAAGSPALKGRVLSYRHFHRSARGST